MSLSIRERTRNSSIHIRDIDLVGEFRSRARLYAVWDRRLWKCTRFFGAAAVTNTALVELFSRYGVDFFVSRFTSEFLASVGCLLERMNMELAGRIAAGAIEADNLDDQLIASEQSAVQNCLAHLHSIDGAGYANTVVEIDRVLTFARCAGSPRKWFSGRAAYARVLQHVADQLGRSASFALQNDRETIGRMLVRHLRGSALGGCLDCRFMVEPLSILDDDRCA
jgi:hypothetical protein